jgi:hypothetical protein
MARMQHMVMIIPVDANVNEAEYIADKLWYQRLKG